MVLTLRTSDLRYYQLAFPTRALHQDNVTRFLVHLADLQQASNRVHVFVDCQDTGIDSTEIPLRDLVKDDVTGVRVHSRHAIVLSGDKEQCEQFSLLTGDGRSS